VIYHEVTQHISVVLENNKKKDRFSVHCSLTKTADSRHSRVGWWTWHGCDY